MKRFILGILGCLVLMLINQQATAQSNYLGGYIVNTSNDTIPGEIDYGVWNNTPKSIKFKAQNDNKVQKLAPTDLLAFYVSNEHFISKEVTIDKTTRRKERLVKSNETSSAKEQLFLQLLFKGKANLYFHQDSKQNNHFFIEKDQVPLIELVYQIVSVEKDGQSKMEEKKRYKGQLLYYLRDCPSVKNDIERLGYVSRNFIQLFQKYEQCMGGNATYTLPKKKVKLQGQVFVGAYTSSATLSQTDLLEETTFKSSTNPLVGLGLQLQLAGKLRHFALSSDLHYESYSAKNSWQKGWNGAGAMPFNRLYEGEISLSYLKWSQMIKYRLNAKKIIPYVGLGISYGWILDSYNNVNLTTSLSSEVAYSGTFLGEMRKTERAYLISAGLSTKKINLEFRYEKGNGFLEGANGVLKATTLMVLVGYLF